MTTFVYILISVFLVSLISFIGVLFVAFKEKSLNKILKFWVSFACGALLGGAFLHLLPESAEQLGEKSFVLVIIAFLVFFLLEKILHWRHCHLGICQAHSFVYLNLFGDGLHNFIDGAIIAAVFLTNPSLGIITTLAVVFHEIPQEIGDFSILLYGGLKKRKALLFNFASAITAVFGALAIYFFQQQISILVPFLLPFAAGGFIYIAATDIIPELHKKENVKESVIEFLLICLGIALMWVLKIFNLG
ncbi:MAG: ZIP family metal transporter [Microgenomates group bacterium]